MIKYLKIVLPFFLLFFISCSNKETKTDFIFHEIDLDRWSEATYNFCCDSIAQQYYRNVSKDSIKFITKYGDTIKTFDDHMFYYLKNRERFLSKLIEEQHLFSKYTDTLVVSESYLDIDNPRISYIVANNYMKYSLIFYFNSENFEEVDRLHPDGFQYEYDSIIESNPNCFIQYKDMFNSVGFQTVFYLNKEENYIESELKWAYFGFSTIDY